MDQVLERLAASLADRYRVERELGAGGMATVYLANDLRHSRSVALKVLRPELAAIIGPERFLQEIRVTANLQHPHILGLIDSGQVDGTVFYVMPFVDGESLRDRLRREKQLPIEHATRITRDVASALDYAHRRAVIHRDIKPENILIHDGAAMVADFGIALAAGSAGGTRLTETGMSLGTPQYMSPEQAMGDRELDARTDVYALGCVLYEMLTGEPPFTGGTAQAILTKVVTSRPEPPRALRATIPEHLEAATLTAIQKLPADRFATAGEFSAALTDSAYRSASTPAVSRARLQRWLVPVIGLAGVVAGVVGTRYFSRGEAATQDPVEFAITGDESAGIIDFGQAPIAISNDGHSIAFASVVEQGTQLFVRALDELQARPVPGSDGGQTPFFSPDRQSVAFETVDGYLATVPVKGGLPVKLVKLSGVLGGGAWGTDGMIYYSDAFTRLMRVPSSGGSPSVVYADSAVPYFMLPALFPDGRHLAIMAWDGSKFRLAVVTPATGRLVMLPQAGVSPWPLSSGKLVYSDINGVVLAGEFDPAEARFVSEPEPTGMRVPSSLGAINSPFAVSWDGTAVTWRQQADYSLVLRGHDGLEEVLVRDAGISNPRFSPDGMRITYRSNLQGLGAIWVYSVASRTRDRIVSEGDNDDPTWTPDGQSIIFTAGRSNDFPDLYEQSADASGPGHLLIARPTSQYQAIATRDGRTILFVDVNIATTLSDIMMFSRGGTEVTPVVATPAREENPELSPDGAWLAYTSYESGKAEVYLRPFPSGGSRVLISDKGGSAPLWSRDGRGVYYVTATGINRVEVSLKPAEATVGARGLVVPLGPEFKTFYPNRNYDIDPRTGRFLLVRSKWATLVVRTNAVR